MKFNSWTLVGIVNIYSLKIALKNLVWSILKTIKKSTPSLSKWEFNGSHKVFASALMAKKYTAHTAAKTK